MGSGNDELGGALMKAFVFALSQQETLPDTILCYNGGVKLTCEGSESLEDLKGMAARGVEILSCGTCLELLRPQGKAGRRRGDEHVCHRRKDERRGPRRASVSMIYLDNAATTLRKPPQVIDAVVQAMRQLRQQRARHARGGACRFARHLRHALQARRALSAASGLTTWPSPATRPRR